MVVAAGTSTTSISAWRISFNIFVRNTFACGDTRASSSSPVQPGGSPLTCSTLDGGFNCGSGRGGSNESGLGPPNVTPLSSAGDAGSAAGRTGGAGTSSALVAVVVVAAIFVAVVVLALLVENRAEPTVRRRARPLASGTGVACLVP